MGRYLRSVRHRALIAAIVEARDATGLSQREFAKKLNRTNNFVWRIEAGERKAEVLEFHRDRQGRGGRSAGIAAAVLRALRVLPSSAPRE